MTTIIALGLGLVAGVSSLLSFKKDYKMAAKFAIGAIVLVYFISWITNL